MIDPTDMTEANLGLGPILQNRLLDPPWMAARTRRLPGVGPLDMGDWLRVDEVFAAQMTLREKLIADQRDKVRAALPGADNALDELLEIVLAALKSRDDYAITHGRITRPDGMTISTAGDPLLVLGRLAVEDFCLLQRGAGQDQHRLKAAVLCFPFQWMLAEKLGRPLTDLHRVVPPYRGQVAVRVQRLFDRLRPGMGLCRTNAVTAANVELFTPRLEADRPPARLLADAAPYIRSERQCLLRLPETGAVVFSIQTRLVRRTSLSAEQAALLAEHPLLRETG